MGTHRITAKTSRGPPVFKRAYGTAWRAVLQWTASGQTARPASRFRRRGSRRVDLCASVSAFQTPAPGIERAGSGRVGAGGGGAGLLHAGHNRPNCTEWNNKFRLITLVGVGALSGPLRPLDECAAGAHAIHPLAGGKSAASLNLTPGGVLHSWVWVWAAARTDYQALGGGFPPSAAGSSTRNWRPGGSPGPARHRAPCQRQRHPYPPTHGGAVPIPDWWSIDGGD